VTIFQLLALLGRENNLDISFQCRIAEIILCDIILCCFYNKGKQLNEKNLIKPLNVRSVSVFCVLNTIC